MTLCFSVPQAIMAARAGARYISPFIGRFDDISEDGLEQVGNIVTAINNYDFTANTANGEQIEIIAASVRSANHVTQCALMGADIATVPFGVLKKMVQHPLTDRGLDSFMKDWVEMDLDAFCTAQPPYLAAAAVDVALKVLNGEEVEPMTYVDLPTCSSKEEAEEKWYQPDQEGGFVCDWTDNNNTWNLTIEDVAPN